MGQSTEKQITGAEKNLKTAGNTGTSIGEQMLKRAAAGQLTDPQQAQVDAMKKEQNARNRSISQASAFPFRLPWCKGKTKSTQTR